VSHVEPYNNFPQQHVAVCINQLHVRQRLTQLKIAARMDNHHHVLYDLGQVNVCDVCKQIDTLIHDIEDQLGPDPKMAKTLEEFEMLILNDPLSKRLFDMGREYQRIKKED